MDGGETMFSILLKHMKAGLDRLRVSLTSFIPPGKGAVVKQSSGKLYIEETAAQLLRISRKDGEDGDCIGLFELPNWNEIPELQVYIKTIKVVALSYSQEKTG